MIDKTNSGDRPRRHILDAPGAKPQEKREGQRIAKVMARAGLCSRRDAEAWIAEGRVVVNGKKLDSPAFNVGPGDDVRVDGKPLAAPERTRLFLYNKPRGLVTTARDPEGRPTIFENLPPDLPRLVAVGRLDINTEGLILLTNDGGLARVLELPATAWLRRYRVRAHGEIAQSLLDPLADGVTIDGVHYAGIEAALDRTQGANVWLTMGLREGKNREIKKVLEHLGLSVNRLIRISFGPFQLGDLEEGAVAEVRTRVLRDQLGPKLAREAGVDFDAPLNERAEPARAERQERPSAPARPRKPRPGGFDEREERARNDPKTSYGPKTRKHVSTLRAERQEEARGPRKRIERGATADRKGREVKVERLLPTIEEARHRAAVAAREAERAARSSRSGDKAKPGDGKRRPTAAPSFRERSGEEMRSRRQETAARSPRRDGEKPQRAGDRPVRPFGKGAFGDAGGREARRGEGPRGGAKPFREKGNDRGPRARGDATSSRGGPDRMAPSRDGGKPKRPPRDATPGGGGSGGRPRGGARPPRRG